MLDKKCNEGQQSSLKKIIISKSDLRHCNNLNFSGELLGNIFFQAFKRDFLSRYLRIVKRIYTDLSVNKLLSIEMFIVISI